MKQETIDRIRKFTADRDWEQFHTPANLAKSIAIEAGELLECFQWSETEYDPEHVKEELADVLVYCRDMLDALDLDEDEIVLAKMTKNEAKYPVEKARGSNAKYTEYGKEAPVARQPLSTIEIHKNSITNLHTDAVVNAANNWLAEGGGVCGAIFKAAGTRLLAAECAKIGRCETGGAVITSACGMTNNKYIIHAVGPVYRGGKNGEPEQLYSCYRAALDRARENGCRSVGFPLISSGIFGYPVDEAWRVALTACKDWINDNPEYALRIVFVRQYRSEVDEGKAILAEL